ncbi:MAG TPA: chromate efflux transporter [Actinomycetota bacterium]|nr:chromate efflux transporter [Actinomycetota bacterium]
MATVPRQTRSQLFFRFLRFGSLAWGGPVAQIGLIRDELVEREDWISRERFNRVLSVYQVLPGPEATELCVYFGHLAGGRLGGVLAGLGFMLPGFALMLALSWAYVRFGVAGFAPDGLFYGFQAAVLALIVRAVYRIGQHVLTDPWLWVLGGMVAAAELAGVHFAVTLPVAGAAYTLVRRGHVPWGVAILAAGTVAVVLVPGLRGIEDASIGMAAVDTADVSTARLFGSGLLAGLLTFGGAYTVIPFLRREAVVSGAWMTDGQFVDGLALSGILPAPLVIFGTFVGYVGGGLAGAMAVTAGIFLPAFAFTLVGHGTIERIVEAPGLHAFLEGVAAGVVGLIVATTVRLAPTSVPDAPAGIIAGVALAILIVWRSNMANAAAVLLSGAMGMLVAHL